MNFKEAQPGKKFFRICSQTPEARVVTVFLMIQALVQDVDSRSTPR